MRPSYRRRLRGSDTMRRMRGIADRLVRLLADVAAFCWFRSVEVSAIERVPPRGPLLVVANHGGGFVDPALLTSVLPRAPRYLAMASLWRYAIDPALPRARRRDPRPSGAGRDDRGEPRYVRRVPRGAARGRGDRDLPRGAGERRPAPAAGEDGRREDRPRRPRRGCRGTVDPARGADVRGQGVGAVPRLRADRTAPRPRRGDPRDGRPGRRSTTDDHDAVEVLTEEIAARLSRGRPRLRRCGRARLPRARGRGRAPPIGGSWCRRSERSEDLARRLAAAPGAADVVEAEGAYRQALEAHAVTDRAVAVRPRTRLPADPCRRDGGHAGAPPARRRGGVRQPRARRSPCTWPDDPTDGPRHPGDLEVPRGDRPVPARPGSCGATSAFGDLPHPWWWTLAAGPVCGLAALWVADRVRRAWRARLDLRRLAATGPASLDELRAPPRRAWSRPSSARSAGSRPA